MKLFERLPDSITVNGKRYRLDLDFRNVLRMMEVMGREDLLADARNHLALSCVMKKVPKDKTAAMQALQKLLFPEPKKKSNKPSQRVTDYVQDADLIRAAFMQSYGINLWRDNLHWFEFGALLSNLPEGSRYSDIIGIRVRPLPEPTKYNAKERQWLIEAKSRFAIEATEQEQENALQASFHATTLSLLALAKRGDDLNAK